MCKATAEVASFVSLFRSTSLGGRMAKVLTFGERGSAVSDWVQDPDMSYSLNSLEGVI